MRDVELSLAEIKLVYLYAETGMRMTRTANALGCNRKTIAARMIDIENKTGLNPRRFHELARIMDLIETEGNVTKSELMSIVTDAVAEKDKEIEQLKRELAQAKRDFDWAVMKLKESQAQNRKKDWLLTEVVESDSNPR